MVVLLLLPQPAYFLYAQENLEKMDDGIGNENALCESNETCLYSPNIGA